MAGKCLAVLTFLIGAVVVATIVAICASFVMAHLRASRPALGLRVPGWAISASCSETSPSRLRFAIIGMIAGVLLRSSVIAIAAGSPSCCLWRPFSPTPSRHGAWLPAQLLESIAKEDHHRTFEPP